MTNISINADATAFDLTMLPNELIHSQSVKNITLRPYLLKGREFSNPDPTFVPYFFMLTNDEIEGLVKRIKTVRYLFRGKLTLAENATDDLYLIFSGKVHVTDKKETRTYRIRESFPNKAEFALLTSEVLTNSQVIIEKTEFSMIKKSEFVKWLLSYPDVPFGFLDVLTEHQAVV